MFEGGRRKNASLVKKSRYGGPKKGFFKYIS